MADLEIFEPEIYLLDDRKYSQQISNYISNFRRGILMDHKPLFFLLLGSYAEKSEKIFVLSEEERISYKSILILLNKIKQDIQDYSILITPHIFTKVANDLRKRINDSEHFKGIVEMILDSFPFVKEEEIKKEEILGFKNFKNMYCGISETAIVIMKNRIGRVGVIAYSDKIPAVCGEDYLFVDFKSLVSTIKEFERREEIN